ncbi:NLR family CARD domain-containing protein 4-like [Apostichopus japonicus]|uniref:NLR family CARD domain-containing protein 4-like n=1 Tax=Stichopus japonicus TaxID=307972 RepID=UPI003AB4FF44
MERLTVSMERLTVQDKKIILIDSLKSRYKLQYDAIQPIPYIKDRLYCVDKVFVEGGTEIHIVEGATKEKEGPWVRVDSYNDIFTDPRVKAKRRIIEAEAGYGKSTVSLQLAYDWCNGVKDSPFEDVEILILLRLRQLNSKISIYQAIKLFLGPKDPRIKSTDIKDIIESCSSVKVLLDGYDEFPDREGATGSDVGRIITRNLFRNIDVTLTTRYPPKDYDQANTKRVRLVGFDEKARDQYIRKAVTGEDEESVSKIKRALKSNPILDALCQVPLFFVMFSHMTHEKVLFMRFNSVTEFFRYMMKCFHSHKSNKSMDRNTRPHNVTYELKFAELSKVAFEGLCGENQQLSWLKDRLCTRLGQGFLKHYIAVGILVEEEVSIVTNEQTSTTDIQTMTDVRFYHQLFCEWFASFRLVEVVAATRGASELKNVLDKVDPFNLQYLYRFACGISPAVGKRIIEYLKSRNDGDKFAILCILEQTGEVDGIKDTVRDLCSKEVDIDNDDDSKLLQRSTIQLLEIASRFDIPISCVWLYLCSPRVDESGLNLILQSGLSLSILSSLQKLEIYDYNRRLTNEELAAILSYSSQCTSLKELEFGRYFLPDTIPVGSIPTSLKSRNVKVLNDTYSDEYRRLNLQTGQWQACDEDGNLPGEEGFDERSYQESLADFNRARRN